MASSVTVAIPVLNGSRYLDEVLGAVRAQDVDASMELLVIDSGSTDGSLDIARKHEARIESIPKRSFSHGGTRNRAVEIATGEYVAFLTQDATPASSGWLAALLEGFKQADDVALVFGPHVPRQDASHTISRELQMHFAQWGDGKEPDVQRLDRSPQGIAAYRRNPGHLTFFSDVNGCVARRAWERVPYRDVPYAEDQLLGREMIEAGFGKVFQPAAPVYHSHDYPPIKFFKRYFDEWRSLREVLGHVEPFGPIRTPLAVRGLVKADRAYLEDRDVKDGELLKKSLHSTRHWTLRMVGAALGSRVDAMPRSLTRRLSLEGREGYSPVLVPTSRLLANGDPALPKRRTARFDPRWPWSFVGSSYPAKPLARDDPTPGIEKKGSLAIAWVLPPWKVGSGGHTTIFRLIRELEKRGHRCTIHVFDPFGREERPAHVLRSEVRRDFIPVDARFFVGLDEWSGADIAIATEWTTAFPVRDLPRTMEKVYLVQDVEDEFYPTSSQQIWAEDTYRMGYRAVAYTPWMADILKERWGLEAEYFECGTDTDIYAPSPVDRDPDLVVLYARQETPRRAVELALVGLLDLFERRPGLKVTIFGSNMTPFPVPFPVENLGVVSPRRLARLYIRASVGLCFSLTTHSLVAQEMMATQLPVVELTGDNVASALGASGERALLAAPDPRSISTAVESLLDDPEGAARMAKRAREFVLERTWERSGSQLEAALRAFLARRVEETSRLPDRQPG